MPEAHAAPPAFCCSSAISRSPSVGRACRHDGHERKFSQETLPGPGSECQEGFQADRVSAFVYAGFVKWLWTCGSINAFRGRFSGGPFDGQSQNTKTDEGRNALKWLVLCEIASSDSVHRYWREQRESGRNVAKSGWNTVWQVHRSRHRKTAQRPANKGPNSKTPPRAGCPRERRCIQDNGGGGGNRTRVRKCVHMRLYVRSLCLKIRRPRTL